MTRWPKAVRLLLRELSQKPTPVSAGDSAPDPILGLMRDDAELMDEIVADAYRQPQRQPVPEQPAASEAKPAQARKPIWERVADIRRSVPEGEWAKLPADGAEQHDHYIYGTPKRTSKEFKEIKS